MSQNKKILLLSTVCVFLCFAFFLDRGITSRAQVEVKGEKLLKDLKTEEISGIEIENGKQVPGIKLNLEDEQWLISASDAVYPADNDRVRALIARLADLSFYSISATKPGDWDKFAVGDTGAKTVKIYIQGEISPHIIIHAGSTVAGADQQYIRVDDEPEVFSSDRIGPYMEGGESDWSDLSILQEYSDDGGISALSCSVKDRGGNIRGSIRIERRSGDELQDDWIITEKNGRVFETPAQADAYPDRIIRGLMSLKGDSFYHGRDFEQLKKDRSLVTCRIESGSEVVSILKIWSGEEHYLVETSVNQYVYKVGTWRLREVINQLMGLMEIE